MKYSKISNHGSVYNVFSNDGKTFYGFVGKVKDLRNSGYLMVCKYPNSWWLFIANDDKATRTYCNSRKNAVKYGTHIL